MTKSGRNRYKPNKEEMQDGRQPKGKVPRVQRGADPS
jgi:hypothetical protein